MTYRDWVEQAEFVLSDLDCHLEFNTTQEYEDALLEWHRNKYPEDWGND